MRTTLFSLLLFFFSLNSFANDCNQIIQEFERATSVSTPTAVLQRQYYDCKMQSILGAGQSHAVLSEQGYSLSFGNYSMDGNGVGTLAAVALRTQFSPYSPSAVAERQINDISLYLGEFETLANSSIETQTKINNFLGPEVQKLEEALEHVVDFEESDWGAKRAEATDALYNNVTSHISTNEIDFPATTPRDSNKELTSFFNSEEVKRQFRTFLDNDQFEELHAETRVQINQAWQVLDLNLESEAFGEKVLTSFEESFRQSFFTEEEFKGRYLEGDPCGFASLAAQHISQEAMVQLEAGNKSTAKNMLRTAGDLFTAFCPGINDARDFAELTTGIDLFTGERLSIFERSLCVVGLVAGSGAGLRKGGKYLKKIFTSSDELRDIERVSSGVLSETRLYGRSKVVGSYNNQAAGGALSDEVASTFSGTRYWGIRPQAGETFYRMGGADGQFWSRFKPNSQIQAMSEHGMLPGWKSDFSKVSKITIPKNFRETLYEGISGNMSGQRVNRAIDWKMPGDASSYMHGGGNQIFIPDSVLKSDEFKKAVKVMGFGK